MIGTELQIKLDTMIKTFERFLERAGDDYKASGMEFKQSSGVTIGRGWFNKDVMENWIEVMKEAYKLAN